MSSIISGLGDFLLSHSGIGHQGAGVFFSFYHFYSTQFLAFLNLRFSISISGVLSSLAGKKREWDRWVGKGVNTVVGLLIFFLIFDFYISPSSRAFFFLEISSRLIIYYLLLL